MAVNPEKVTQGLQLLRTVHLGLAFMLIFSADNARSNFMKLFNMSIHQDKPSYSVDGYVVLGLVYVIYGLSLLVAPSLITFTGPRGAMNLGVVMMTAFLFLLLLEETWATYVGIGLTGVGGSFVWVGQGNYLVLNSEPKNHGLHVSLFWAIFTLSTMLGNIYTVMVFAGKTQLDFGTRRSLVFAMCAVGMGSTVLFFALRKAERKSPLTPVRETALQAFVKTVAISTSREFLTLLIVFVFIGFQQSFGWGIHSACVGFTSSFGDFSTELAPITAAIYGAGGTLGGALHVIGPHFLQMKWSRRYVLGIGFVMQVLALIGIFVNLPNSSVFGKTDEAPYVGRSMVWLACLCSFLMGMGDSFYNTQLYPLLASLHPAFSAHTVALYKFSKSMAMAGFYFGSISIGLHPQICVMLATGIFAVICFGIVDRKVCQKERSNVEPSK